MTTPTERSQTDDFDMALGEAMRTQRAIRRLTTEPVGDEIVHDLIELATKAPTAQNLLLGARAAGLGANLMTMPLTINFMARRALGIPWRVTPVAIVSLGWPKGRYGPTTRLPVEAVTHLDRYGNQPWSNGDGP